MAITPGEGGGGTLIFSYIRRLRSFWGGSKFWISTFLGVFRKMIFFFLGGGGWRFCGYFFWDITKLVYFKWSFLCILGSFLKVKVQNRDILGGCQNFTYLFGMLEILDIFLGWTAKPDDYKPKVRELNGQGLNGRGLILSAITKTPCYNILITYYDLLCMLNIRHKTNFI